MSPFTYANRINEPILLIHGEAADGPLAHKNAAVDRIFAAFDAMLDRACWPERSTALSEG